jgi:hypothetical protein
MNPSETLAEFLQQAFLLVSRGVADRRSAFHTPTLATVSPDGWPEARTVVLRGFDPQARRLRLHTDQRSRKIAALTVEPRCEVHFYDAGWKLQLRLAGRASIHGDDAVAAAAWQASRPASRRCYSADPGPGSVVPHPPAAPADDAAGWPVFRVLMLDIRRVDVLELAAKGHRRARFTWNGDGAVDATWLMP